jgi:hypothetical protein
MKGVAQPKELLGILIDGDRLADLMIQNNIGVAKSHSYDVTLSQIIQAVKAMVADRQVRRRHRQTTRLQIPPDRRSDHWLKLPLKPSQHFAIGAYRLDGKRLDILLVGPFAPTLSPWSLKYIFGTKG